MQTNQQNKLGRRKKSKRAAECFVSVCLRRIRAYICMNRTKRVEKPRSFDSCSNGGSKQKSMLVAKTRRREKYTGPLPMHTGYQVHSTVH